MHWNLSEIRNLKLHLSVKNAVQLVLSLVILHIDFSNGLLTGVPSRSYKLLQYVQDISAKVILNKLHRDTSTECMLELPLVEIGIQNIVQNSHHSSQMPI